MNHLFVKRGYGIRYDCNTEAEYFERALNGRNIDRPCYKENQHRVQNL